MSLIERVNSANNFIDADPGFISESAMESLNLAIISESLSPEEIGEFVSESNNYEAIFEAQKNIVRLNKQAKLNRAYKVAVLQCAAEDGRKEYKKLRTLWKMEAAIFKKLERMYKNKALARAKVAVKNLSKKKNPLANVAANRANKAIDNKLMHGSLKSAIIKK